ncbi:MAG: hypothetical protein ACI841_004029 [Planctomycetota bacterium]|jgi:hypothetical protein
MTLRDRFWRPLLVVGPLVSFAAAQGADDCVNADIIAGTGVFAFDNTAATVDGVPDSLCYFFGLDDIDFDVWYSWTAPLDGLYSLETCGQTAVDTKVAIYDGACGSPILACNDDNCGLQSGVDFNAISGSAYTIRLGTFPGSAGGLGTFEIKDNLPVLNPANGHYYLAVASQGILWNDAKLAAEAVSFGGNPGHLATVSDAAENAFISGNMTVAGSTGSEELWLGGFQDLTSGSYSEPSGAWSWVTGEPWIFDNWAAGEPNDAPAPEDFLIYMPNSNPNEWNDAREDHWNIRGYVIEFDGGASIGSNYCLAVPNSTTQPSVISASGQDSVSANNLTLSAEPQPMNQPGIFYYGPNQVQQVFGNGFRCIGAGATGIARLPVVNSGSGGVMSHAVDLSSPPTPSTQITAGSTWNFQAWYRDPLGGGAAFNLSDALEITFTP